MVSGLARSLEGNLWVCAEGQGLLFPGEAIGEAPVLPAFGIDQQEHAAAVRQLEGLFSGLGILDRYSSEFSNTHITPFVGTWPAGVGYTSSYTNR